MTDHDDGAGAEVAILRTWPALREALRHPATALRAAGVLDEVRGGPLVTLAGLEAATERAARGWDPEVDGDADEFLGLEPLDDEPGR